MLFWVSNEKIIIRFEQIISVMNMTRFHSSKNTFIISFLWGVAIFLLLIIIVAIISGERNMLSIVFVCCTIALIAWILLDTRYDIKNKDLLYRSGPFRGRISILDINKIERFSGTNPPVTMKPALDNKGFILFYKETNTLFISPEKSEIFIQSLLEVNKDIVIAPFT